MDFFLLLSFMLHICLCYAVLSVLCSLEITYWERVDLLALLRVFLCFVTFPRGVLGQIWYLIISIPALLLAQN